MSEAQQNGGVRSAVDTDTHPRIIDSVSPHTVDGYWPGEPKYLQCPSCSAWTLLTEDPDDPGWQEMAHDADCLFRDSA